MRGAAGSGRGGQRRARGPEVEIAPVRSTRVYEEIVRQVRAMIAEGRLRTGDRLPPERDLADRFVVSRTSVREALRTLESLGLVEIRPGEGAFVREAIGELFEARRLLEPGIAALAARRATPADLEGMTRIVEAQALEVASGGTGLAHDARFHAAIAAATHNQAIRRIAGAIMDLLAESHAESLRAPGRPARSHEDHRRVLEAISDRDAGAAERAMREHIDEVERLLAGSEAPARA